MTANVVISAVGFLSRPKFPAIEGMDSFIGPAFHTAWWDQTLDVKGKHFGVIGTGCSGMQLVPELERMGATVTVFQRRPSWVFEVPIYRSELPEGVRWLDRNLPLFRNFEKFRAIWAVGDHVNATPFFKDPEWSDPDSLSAINSRARQVSLDYLQRKLADHPDLLEVSIPNSPAMASRPVIDNGWLDAITGPNVELISESIARIVPEGIVTASGRTVEVDVSSTRRASKQASSSGPWTSPSWKHGQRAVGDRRRSCVSGHRAPRVPEPLLHLRPQHELEPRNVADHGLGAANPLRHPVHR
jgi:4-hydroxyacetophenone monooxygenase